MRPKRTPVRKRRTGLALVLAVVVASTTGCTGLPWLDFAGGVAFWGGTPTVADRYNARQRALARERARTDFVTDEELPIGVYSGRRFDGLPDGYGRLQQAQWELEGRFRAGHLHGPATARSENGFVLSGRWYEGRPVLGQDSNTP